MGTRQGPDLRWSCQCRVLRVRDLTHIQLRPVWLNLETSCRQGRRRHGKSVRRLQQSYRGETLAASHHIVSRGGGKSGQISDTFRRQSLLINWMWDEGNRSSRWN